ncbi:hypothetical protein, partial [Shinella kummerowiae]|uniref:hypothetical protein n=1 Tax=Shinella kummerowiae TaxID=417745 RepID=UPI0021B621E8
KRRSPPFPQDPMENTMAKQTTPKQTASLGENETLNGSNTLPALIEIAPDRSVQLGEVVLEAFHVSGLTAEAWNALLEAERDSLLNAAIEALKASESRKASGGPAFKPFEFGPRAKQEIRYGGKTYAPGERLPADVDDTTLDELDEIDAI